MGRPKSTFYFASSPSPSSNQISLWQSCRGQKGQRRGFLPYRPAALPSPLSSSLLPPRSHLSPLPVAPGIPPAESRRGESRTSLAAAPHGLSLAAEPLGDNFDGHNDAGGNHFNEDQFFTQGRSSRACAPPCPDPQCTVRVRRPAAQGERSAATRRGQRRIGTRHGRRPVSFRSGRETLAIWALGAGPASPPQH